MTFAQYLSIINDGACILSLVYLLWRLLSNNARLTQRVYMLETRVADLEGRIE